MKNVSLFYEILEDKKMREKCNPESSRSRYDAACGKEREN